MDGSNSIIVQNERKANQFSAKIMLFSVFALASVYFLELLGIFKDDINKLNITFPIATVFLLIPALMILVFKIEGRWTCYFIVSLASLAVAVINLVVSKDVPMLWIYSIAIASIYFSRKLCLYSVTFSIITLSTSQIAATVFRLFEDKNYSNDWFTPVLSRNVELLLLALIYIILASRTRELQVIWYF